jgi:hypothetical protein
MLNIESLMEMWKKDSVLNLSLTEIKDEFTRIPLLHSKYLDILIHSRLMLKKNQDKYYKMKKLKWEYYTGKLDEDTMKEYGWEPFAMKLKSDIAIYIDADEDLQKIKSSMYLCEQMIDFCDKVLGELKARTFQLRDVITWERLVQGAN